MACTGCAHQGQGVLEVEHHHVRLRGAPHGESEPFQSLGEESGVRVVLGQALHVVFQGVHPGSGQKAGLTHSASEHLSDPPQLVDSFGGGADQ